MRVRGVQSRSVEDGGKGEYDGHNGQEVHEKPNFYAPVVAHVARVEEKVDPANGQT